MRIHALIHASFEKVGVIEEWAHQKNHSLTFTHTYQGEPLPSLSSVDFLIVMGGPQSAVALDSYPYLKDEVAFTKQAIDAKKPVLGICLGAQIISISLGAKAEQSPHKEIGVFPVELTHEGQLDPLFKSFPKIFDVMHWHNDMPGISKDSVLLAHSKGCPRQAFRYQDHVYGLQFHLELTPSLIHGMIEHAGNDLTPEQYVQDAKQLLTLDLTDINRKMISILNYLAQK